MLTKNEGTKHYYKSSWVVTGIAVLCLMLVLVVHYLSPIFINKNPFSIQNIGGFYELRENSLDAVYIGSSRVFTYWAPVFAFRDHGISVFNMATTGQTIDAAQFLIEEALKTQPNAVMIINLATFNAETNANLHRVTDRMRFSKTKIDLINAYIKWRNLSFSDSIEFFVPFYIYHSRWKELTKSDFDRSYVNYMSTCHLQRYISGIQDATDKYPAPVNESTPVAGETKAILDELIDYIQKNNVRALFTLAPQADVSTEELMVRNGMRDYIRSRGGNVLDMQNSAEEIGIDLTCDYMDYHHLNLKGSIKFTEYLARYLIDTYGFTDKRNDPAYSDWWEALANYERFLADSKSAVPDASENIDD